MIFYLELEHRNNRFRLQSDKISWRKVTSSDLEEKDFTTKSVLEIVTLQKLDTTLKIDDTEWRIHPQVSRLSDKDILYYKVYTERAFFPLIPSKEQLKTVILHGDDRFFNSLILNVYGFYELRNFRTLSLNIKDPTIVFRHGTFGSGNGYVGAKVTDKEIDNYYKITLEYWLTHLENGITNMYSDDRSNTSLESIMNGLEKVKTKLSKIDVDHD